MFDHAHYRPTTGPYGLKPPLKMAAPPRRSLRQRTGATIPRDQLNILAQDTSWGQSQAINVPDAVKQALIQATIAEKKRQRERERQQVQESTQPETPRPAKAARRRIKGSSSPDTPVNSFPVSSPGTNLSWTPSERDENQGEGEIETEDEDEKQRGLDMVDEKDEEEDAEEGGEEEEEQGEQEGDMNHLILSQPPSPAVERSRKEPPSINPSIQPPPPETHTVHSPTAYEFPLTIEEEELEMDIPQFATQPPQAHVDSSDPNPFSQHSIQSPQHPFDSSAQGMPFPNHGHVVSTPPCAQDATAVVPGTTSPYKPISKPIESKELGRAYTNASLETKTSRDPGSSGNTATTGCVVPGTMGSMEVPDSRPTLDHVEMTDPPRELVPASGRDSNPILEPMETSQPASPGHKELPPRPQAQTSAVPVGSALPASDTRDLLPSFELFTTIYPTYLTDHKGSLECFVKACMCLDHLRKRCCLHHFLWDDFIRAFSSGFMKYLEHTDREPMGALEWFSSLAEPPLFTKMIIQQANLAFVLGSYQAEVDALSNFIHRRQERHANHMGDNGARQDRAARHGNTISSPMTLRQRLNMLPPTTDNDAPPSVESTQPGWQNLTKEDQTEPQIDIEEEETINDTSDLQGHEPIQTEYTDALQRPATAIQDMQPKPHDKSRGLIERAISPSIFVHSTESSPQARPVIYQPTPPRPSAKSPELGFEDDRGAPMPATQPSDGPSLSTGPARLNQGPRPRKAYAKPSISASGVTSTSPGLRKLSYMDRIRKRPKVPNNPKKEAERRARIEASARNMPSSSFASTRSGAGR